MKRWVLVTLLVAGAAWAQNPDLERASEEALEAANTAVDSAREALHKDDVARLSAALDAVKQDVNAAYGDLVETHKTARKSKYFKRAEIRTRALMRRLTGLQDDVNADDRDRVAETLKSVQDVHDHLLNDIMSKGK